MLREKSKEKKDKRSQRIESIIQNMSNTNTKTKDKLQNTVDLDKFFQELDNLAIENPPVQHEGLQETTESLINSDQNISF